MVTLYRLARPLAARLLGSALVMLALVVVATSLVVAASGRPVAVLLAVAGAGVLLVAAAAWWLFRGVAVLRLDDAGYRVRLIRGAGVPAARWAEVEDAATSYAGAEPVLVLRLRDGRTTTIPVRVLAGDREELVRAVQARLQAGHGLQPLDPPDSASPGGAL